MESTASQHTYSKGRRVAVAVILVFAVITGYGAIMSTWVKRQVVDTSGWKTTSAKLLADEKIRTAVGAYMADQLFSKVNVASELQKVLPPQADALAVPAAAGLRQLASRAAPELLARPRVQQAWVNSNVAAHAQLMAILHGGGSLVSTKNGEVRLNLHGLVTQLAQSLGVGSQLAALRAKLNPSTRNAARSVASQKLGVTIPSATGGLLIMRSDQLKTAQNVAKGIKNLSIAFTIATFVLFAAAIALARGHRRLTLRTVGWCFVGLGALALLSRRVAGNNVVDGLVSSETARPAAHNAWQIATSMLYDIGVAFLIYGVLIVVGAWLAGSSRWATNARRELAIPMHDHMGMVWGAVAGVYLLVLAWGPTPAFRQPLPILLIAALIAFGVEVLRRQVVREFPALAPEEATRTQPPIALGT